MRCLQWNRLPIRPHVRRLFGIWLSPKLSPTDLIASSTTAQDLPPLRQRTLTEASFVIIPSHRTGWREPGIMDVLTLTAIVKPGKTATLTGYGTVTLAEPDINGLQLITVVLRQKGLRRLHGGQRGVFDKPSKSGDTMPS